MKANFQILIIMKDHTKPQGGKMPILRIPNSGISDISISNLGKRKPLSQLSSKRITRAVREALRQKVQGGVKVFCEASYDPTTNRWEGTCVINGQNYNWELF